MSNTIDCWLLKVVKISDWPVHLNCNLYLLWKTWLSCMINKWKHCLWQPIPLKKRMQHYELAIEVSLSSTIECWLWNVVKFSDWPIYLNCNLYLPWYKWLSSGVNKGKHCLWQPLPLKMAMVHYQLEIEVLLSSTIECSLLKVVKVSELAVCLNCNLYLPW